MRMIPTTALSLWRLLALLAKTADRAVAPKTPAALPQAVSANHSYYNLNIPVCSLAMFRVSKKGQH